MKLKNILLYSVASLLLAGCSKSNTSKMDIFIDQLMDEMTVKEKIGQLNLNVSGGFVAGEGINGNTVPLEQRIENGEIGGLFGLKKCGSDKALATSGSGKKAVSTYLCCLEWTLSMAMM